ncbi:potassium channel family protein [Mesorhizobium sp. ASY16-5R]|uniref:potassium channel family protein n=1 Tax=Mesorhizobium sp. ASY16-5R TaxID=3445772 RepID=UPI003FA0A695
MSRHIRLRRWLYIRLQPTAWHRKGLSRLNKFIVLMIAAAVLVAILESEPTIYFGRENLFLGLELMFGSIFLVEYLARLWTSAEDPRYGGGFLGYVRYALSLPAIIDLLAMSTLFLTFYGNETSILRLFRLLRILSLAKLGRYSKAFHAIGHAVYSRRYELLMSLMIATVLLLVSSTLLYIIEGEGQPAAFGSIPRAMWWSIATLTTVGYGDVIPQTALGKMLAGLTAITGIGLIAMPTGILAAAFSDAIQQHRLAQEREREEREERGTRRTDETPEGPV